MTELATLQFNCDDLVAGVGNHNIAALFEDNKRNLWVRTDRGVYIYDPRIDVFTHLNFVYTGRNNRR